MLGYSQKRILSGRMLFKINKKFGIVSIFNYIFIIFYIVLYTVSLLEVSFGKWLLLLIFIYNLFLIYKYKHSQVFIIFLIFTSTYWFYLLFYFFLNIPYSNHMSFQTLENSVFTLRLQSLFFVVLFNSLKIPKGELIKEKLVQKNNSIIFYCNVLILIVIMNYGIVGNTIFETTYGSTEEVGTPLLEYYFIFFIVAYLYAGTGKRNIILILINFIYVIVLTLHGLRLVTIIVLLFTFLLYFDKKIKTPLIVIGSFTAFFLFSFFSGFRSGYEVGWKEIFGIYNGVLQTNQGDVFQASVVHMGMVQEGYFDFTYRLKAFFGFWLNIFLPSSLQVQETILNQNLGNFRVGGGGFISGYAYVYMGYLGVILLPLYIAKSINNIFTKKNEFLIVYGVFILATFPRWYPYSIYIIFKMGFWLLLGYLIIKLVHAILYKSSGRK